MANFLNYYQIKSVNQAEISDRFPKNHVKFSPLLAPVNWIDRIYKLFGAQAFMSQNELLREFDSSAPLDRYIGNLDDLANMRQILISHCDGIDNNPYLSAIGRFLLKKISIDSLKNRKRILQFYEKNKEFIESNGKFHKPLIVAGSPRSGTTLLQRLLCEDPNTRSPYTFELELPLPPLTSGADPLKDSRIKKSAAAIKTLSQLAPGFVEKFNESHLWSATEMEETIDYTLAHNGITQMNGPLAGLKHIKDMLKVEDKRSLFLYEQLFFKILDAYRPARSHWVLKATEYARYFPLIFSEYENARVVLTHRNPLITLPSLCRLWETWCISFGKNGTFDKHHFGQFIKVVQERYLSVPLNYRKANPESCKQIFDCMYEDLFSDPIATVKKIYQKFDLEYTAEFEQRMVTYLENNKQGKYGRHKYSLEEYGFKAEDLYEEFREYMEYYSYGIPEKFERPASIDFVKRHKKI